MVAEQVPGSGPLDFATSFGPVSRVSTTITTTRPLINHITLSSGEEFIGAQTFKKNQTTKC